MWPPLIHYDTYGWYCEFIQGTQVEVSWVNSLLKEVVKGSQQTTQPLTSMMGTSVMKNFLNAQNWVGLHWSSFSTFFSAIFTGTSPLKAYYFTLIAKLC